MYLFLQTARGKPKSRPAVTRKSVRPTETLLQSLDSRGTLHYHHHHLLLLRPVKHIMSAAQARSLSAHRLIFRVAPCCRALPAQRERAKDLHPRSETREPCPPNPLECDDARGGCRPGPVQRLKVFIISYVVVLADSDWCGRNSRKGIRRGCAQRRTEAWHGMAACGGALWRRGMCTG